MAYRLMPGAAHGGPRGSGPPAPDQAPAEPEPPPGDEPDLSEFVPDALRALLYLLAALALLALIVFLTRLVVPGPLES